MRVIAIAVHSVDGIIAQNQEDSLSWVSKEDRKYFKNVTTQAGVLIMGRKTYTSIGRALPNRLNVIRTSTPEKYNNQPDVLEFTNSSPKEILNELQSRGFDTVFIAGGQQTYSEFLSHNLIDELWISVEPILLGQGIKPYILDNKINLKFISSGNLGENTLLLKYSII